MMIKWTIKMTIIYAKLCMLHIVQAQTAIVYCNNICMVVIYTRKIVTKFSWYIIIMYKHYELG